jgi:hypothetical protein
VGDDSSLFFIYDGAGSEVRFSMKSVENGITGVWNRYDQVPMTGKTAAAYQELVLFPIFHGEILKKRLAYQIKVKGLLDQKWSKWFDDFRIERTHSETILTGCVPDQAALHGLLAKIRDLGLMLLSVKFLDVEDDNS